MPQRQEQDRVSSHSPQAPPERQAAGGPETPGEVHGYVAEPEAAAAGAGEEDPGREGDQGSDRGGEEDEGVRINRSLAR